LTKAKALRIHQEIARKLGIKILSGKLRPGAAFEGEIERSAALGVSRTAYREAIRILIAKGLLESRPKAGTHVTPRARWNLLDPQVLAWAFSGEPDAHFIGDLFELRGIIEPAAAALAAARRTAQQLELMRAALDGMRRLTLASDAGQAADQDFHRVILQAAHNDALASLSGSVGAAVTWTTLFKQRHQPLPRDPLPEHEAVFSAISKGNPKRARTAMENLLRLALEDMGVIRK
jgi:DNA-binding FadR family transcriptional regulator